MVPSLLSSTWFVKKPYHKLWASDSRFKVFEILVEWLSSMHSTNLLEFMMKSQEIPAKRMKRIARDPVIPNSSFILQYLRLFIQKLSAKIYRYHYPFIPFNLGTVVADSFLNLDPKKHFKKFIIHINSISLLGKLSAIKKRKNGIMWVKENWFSFLHFNSNYVMLIMSPFPIFSGP